MGTYVEQVPEEPFEWGSSVYSGTGSETTKDLVKTKFDRAIEHEDEMLVLLNGYLGDLNALTSASVDWTEGTYDTTLYSTLFTRLSTDLQLGATGVASEVEQEYINRAQARQDIIDDKLEQETLEFYASRGFTLPTGAMQAATAELANERARNRTDLNGKVLIEQAELAQKNSQFIIGIAKDVETMLRDFFNKVNDRSLEYAKAIAQLREKIAEAMANIGMQAVASWAGSVNASAGLQHSTGRHEQESFSHNESRQIDFQHSNSLSEGHQYEHDPAA